MGIVIEVHLVLATCMSLHLYQPNSIASTVQALLVPESITVIAEALQTPHLSTKS